MYCPQCQRANPTNALQCPACRRSLAGLRERVYIGHQFVLVRGDDANPVTLLVDDALRTFAAPAILSRHLHAVGFGDQPWSAQQAKAQEAVWRREEARRAKRFPTAAELPPLPRLPLPALQFLTVVTDRKIYKPGEDPMLFIIAPDAAGKDAAVEIQLAGQKVYEATARLNDAGVVLHRYESVKEGEYTAIVRLPSGGTAECAFSAAEYTLAPLIATLRHYEFDPALRHLNFELGVMLLSQPYTGPVEIRLDCPTCRAWAARGAPDWGDLVPRWLRRFEPALPQPLQASGGTVRGSFALCSHEGPFHLEAVTPEGHTASVALPNLGASERELLPISRLGRAADLSLAPWAGAEPLRGCYVGVGGSDTAPLFLSSVVAERGSLRGMVDLGAVQLVTVDPRRAAAVTNHGSLASGEAFEFDVAAPYTLFMVAAFTPTGPFEGWGVVLRPVGLSGSLSAPELAEPGAEIEVDVQLEGAGGAYCWLLAYDARLEHESPFPRLGKRIYDSIRAGASNLTVGNPPDGEHWQPFSVPLPFSVGTTGLRYRGFAPPRALYAAALSDDFESSRFQKAHPQVMEQEPVTVDLVASPARMDFPELVHNELLWVDGAAARTIRLGQQIGTWRVRAYLLRDVDCVELTADLQADKALYAEPDLPAIASDGDEITAAVSYQAGDGAHLAVDTPAGRTEADVSGNGRLLFTLNGPGKVEVLLSGRAGQDWSVREVARPGVQRVTASRLAILRQNETVRAERVVVYAAVGQVLKDTITALIGYPFG